MAHESFEHAETAALMNDHFVSIKVDREERPDVDAVYMEATTALTGQGGWPMTVFATPDGLPFVCGTYFPRNTFQNLLLRVSEAWQTQRAAVVNQGQRIVDALNSRTVGVTAGAVTAERLDAGVEVLAGEFDTTYAGFGGAPKFPPSMCLEYLLRSYARSGSPTALAMVQHTCERMARGGIYDQLGGGFHRYSVDVAWVVPHFEKMLYDNALLLSVYLHLWRQTGDALAARVVRETAAFLLRDMRTPEGGFASALDADTEGEEGRYYVWTPAEVGEQAAALFGVTPAGTFEAGRSVLQLPRDPDDPDLLTGERARLFEIRSTRVPPLRDDKVVAAWNGLAIAALAESGALLGEHAWLTAAEQAADLLVRTHIARDGRLRRTSRHGVPGPSAGVLEDYGDVAAGLLALYSATGNPHWVRLAGQLLDVVLDQFAAPTGGFFDTARDAEQLVRRPQDPTDNATPSGASASAGALFGYAALTGSQRHRAAGEQALNAGAGLLPTHARFAGWSAAVGEAALAGPVEVAVVGPPGPERRELESIARRSPSPGLVLAVSDPQAGAEVVPLLRGRTTIDGRPAAYVCRNFVCERPVTEPNTLAAALGVAPAPSR